MTEKPNIVRVVADEARQLYYKRQRDRNALPRPRVLGEEIGVEFVDEGFIPYADLGYSHDIGFFRLSEIDDVANDAAPYASGGRLIDLGQIVITSGASRRLVHDEIRELLDRHSSGDYGEYGEFFDLDLDGDMLRDDLGWRPDPGVSNKINTLTGMEAIVSAYVIRNHRLWVITEAGETRTTVVLYIGPARD